MAKRNDMYEDVGLCSRLLYMADAIMNEDRMGWDMI